MAPGKFTKLWKDPIRDALYMAVSGANRDLEAYIAPNIPEGELRNALRVRGVYWPARGGPVPKKIISGLFFEGQKQTKEGKPRKDEIANQYIVNILVTRGKIQTPSEAGVFRYWELQLAKNWETQTSNISRLGT